MPIGVQLVGAMGDDARLLRHAVWLVNATAKISRRRRKR
jgi:Asp-tRNA(Asn)/Glu-tRNA(Gln) amidotransferase A subunit family amidase